VTSVDVSAMLVLLLQRTESYPCFLYLIRMRRCGTCTAEGFVSLGYMFFYFNDFSSGEEGGGGVDGEVGRANRQGVLDEKER
jgi:hypothetical protein